MTLLEDWESRLTEHYTLLRFCKPVTKLSNYDTVPSKKPEFELTRRATGMSAPGILLNDAATEHKLQRENIARVLSSFGCKAIKSYVLITKGLV